MNEGIKRIGTDLNQQASSGAIQALFGIYKDTYDLEQHRKDTLENKASMVLGFSGIIAGLITGIIASTPSTNILFLLVYISSILCFTLAGIFALLAVKLMNYMNPFTALTPEEIDDLYTKGESLIKNEVIKNYSDSILNNSALNDKKAKKLVIAFYSATLGIVLTLIASLVVILPIL